MSFPRTCTNVTDGTKCTVLILKSADGCKNCMKHCKDSNCLFPNHVEYRRVAGVAAKTCPSGMTKEAIVKRPDMTCPPPCKLPLIDHPNAPEAPASPTSTAGAAAAAGALTPARITAESMGLEAEHFRIHPIHMKSHADWAPFIASVCGRPVAELELRELLTDMGNPATTGVVDKYDKILESKEKFVSLFVDLEEDRAFHLRGLGGLLAVSTSLEAHKDITIPAAALAKDAPGDIPAADAVNDTIVSRLERRGRSWFLAVVERLISLHSNDPVQYVSGTRGQRTSRPWVARCALILLAGYRFSMSKRKTTWVPPTVRDLLIALGPLPMTNTVVPINLLPLLVVAGLLATLHDARAEVLGDRLLALETGLTHYFGQWQAKYIENALHRDVWKEFNAQGAATVPTTTPKPAAKVTTGGGGGGGAGNGRGGRGAGGVATPQLTAGPAAAAAAALAAANLLPAAGSPTPPPPGSPLRPSAPPFSITLVPQPLRGYVTNPLQPSYNKCMNPACPPRGPFAPAFTSKTPFCRTCAPALYAPK